ncbi:hypothetical protein KI387_023573, partial [Taxus chinensis]
MSALQSITPRNKCPTIDLASPLISSHNYSSKFHCKPGIRLVRAKAGKEENNNTNNNNDKGKQKKTKQSLFGNITEALDFSQARSEEDAMLIEDARAATKSGEKMSREQYAALRRKIGGTYKDFFKGYID